ncbi:MAG: hypothetical protein LC720_06810, partial [Actinobacteria bacterium]|nr:hypothetical protein [Actinomycetota bacterium]
MVGLAVAGLLGGCGSTPAPGDPAPAASARAAQTVTKSFAVFRRTARPADTTPPAITGGGPAPVLSRLAYSGPLGTLYAYVRRGLLCVSYTTRVDSAGGGSASGGCGSPVTARLEGVAAPVLAGLNRPARLALLLPDGVRRVTLTRSPGPPATLPVTGNVLVYAGPGLRAWSFTAQGQRYTGALPARPPARPGKTPRPATTG